MRCNHCGLEKPSEDFYMSSPTKCKTCTKAAVLKNRIKNIERIRAYDRMRGSMSHRVAARSEYRKTTAYAESHEAAAKRWENKHPERRKAHIITGNAIKNGKLLKQPCWVCGNGAEAHHPDYDRPLDVVWLCNPHHKQTHALVESE